MLNLHDFKKVKSVLLEFALATVFLEEKSGNLRRWLSGRSWATHLPFVTTVITRRKTFTCWSKKLGLGMLVVTVLKLHQQKALSCNRTEPKVLSLQKCRRLLNLMGVSNPIVSDRAAHLQESFLGSRLQLAARQIKWPWRVQLTQVNIL